MQKEFIDYDWKNNNTSHHKYLITDIKKLLNPIKNETLNKNYLDVGCGNGYLTKIISVFFKKTWGIDISRQGIKLAKKKFKKIRFICQSIDVLKKEKKKFDFISALEVIEHQYLPDEFLKSTNTLLKKNGFFLISTPYNGYIKNLIINLLNMHDKHYDPLWRHGHIKFFTIKTLSYLLKSNSFKIIKMKLSGRLYPINCSMIFLCQKT